MLKLQYCDLNIPVSSKCFEVCKAALEKGYSTLALNTIIVARECLPQVTRVGKKRKFELRDSGTVATTALNVGSATNELSIPKPVDYPWIQELQTTVPGSKIIRRITIVFGDAIAELQKIVSHPNCQMYDIIAVIPLHMDAVQGCLTARNINFDIISFDLEGPYWMKKLKLSRQKGSMAADREIYFEITYSAGFHGDSPCENMIYTANTLMEEVCTRRFKNIILTSGSLKPDEIRSPKDITSLGFLLGFDENTTINTVREHPQRIVANAENRKHGKSWVIFRPLQKAAQEEVKQ